MHAVLVDERQLVGGQRGKRQRLQVVVELVDVELAPISAEVTSGRRSTHCKASWASDWPRLSASLFSAAVRCR